MTPAREHEMNAITRVATAATMLGTLLGAMPLGAAPIETGRQIADVNGAPMVVVTYRPVGCSDPSLLMVFHGIARNARTYRDDASALADRLCLLVVAPLFDRQAFPGWRYQRGGIVKGAAVQDARDFTGRLVLDLVDWVRRQEGRPIAVCRSPRRLRAERGAAHRGGKCGKLRVSEPRHRRALRTRKGLFGNGGRGSATAISATAADDLSRPRRYPRRRAKRLSRGAGPRSVALSARSERIQCGEELGAG